MKLSEILEKETMYRVAKSCGLSPSWFMNQIKTRGFSARSISAISKYYPEIDIKDLLETYPLKEKENTNVTEDTANNRPDLVRPE